MFVILHKSTKLDLFPEYLLIQREIELSTSWSGFILVWVFNNGFHHYSYWDEGSNFFVFKNYYIYCIFFLLSFLILIFFFCSQGEEQILNFQTQQYKLFSVLSKVFALFYTAHSVIDVYKEVFSNNNKEKMHQLNSVS